MSEETKATPPLPPPPTDYPALAAALTRAAAAAQALAVGCRSSGHGRCADPKQTVARLGAALAEVRALSEQ